MGTSKVVVSGGRIRRRRHSPEFKAALIAACRQPGVSLASVALSNGVNANLLRRWVIDAEGRSSGDLMKSGSVVPVPTAPSTGFVPATIASPAAHAQAIEVELRRGPLAIRVSWPASASGDCGAWLRDLLR